MALRKPADKNFLVVRFASKLKSLAIPLTLCNSLVMPLRLHLVSIFEDHCTGSFLDFVNFCFCFTLTSNDFGILRISSQLTITCPKLTIETLGKVVKYVQS